MTNKKTLALLIALASLFLMQSAATPFISGEARILGYRCLAFYDGHYEDRYLVDDGAGNVTAMTWSEMVGAVSPAAWQKLVVKQDIRWEETSRVDWAYSPYARNFQSEFKKVFKKFVNKNRGSQNVPDMKLTSKTVNVVGDPRTAMDSQNVIYMTQDDRFFQGKSGVAAYMNVWFGSGGSIPFKNGRFTSPHKILEVDGFFRSTQFDAPPVVDGIVYESFNSDLVLTHEFGHAFGFSHTPYTNDYMSYQTQHVNAKSLKKGSSDTWKLSKERDKMYYDDNYQSAARMLPLDGDVVDIRYLHAPNKSDDTLDGNSNHPLTVTSLKGFPGDEIEVSVYDGVVKTTPAAKKPLFKIKGSSIDWTFDVSGTTVYRKYRLSILYVGLEKYWKKLNKAINQKGKKSKINGVTFNRAMQGTIVVKGYQNEGEAKKKTTSRTVWFVN